MSCLLPGGPSSAPAGSSGSPPSSSPVRQACVTEAAGLLQEALRAALGLPQPRLLGLIQVPTTGLLLSVVH